MVVKTPSVRTILVCFCFIFISAIVAAIAYSEMTARRYISDLRLSATSTRSAVTILEKSINSPLLDDPDATTSARTDDAQKLKKAIAICRHRIDELSAKSNTLPSLGYAEGIGTFAIADTLKERSRYIVNQTNDTLKRYGDTISFLEVYATSLEKSTKIMDEFNAIGNFNDYAGRGDYFRGMAATIQTQTDLLNNTPAPTELATIKETGVQNMRQLSSHLQTLGYGMDVAIDSIIYSSVRDIESANAQLNTLAEKTYGETVNQLRVVKDIYDINEKLDLILS